MPSSPIFIGGLDRCGKTTMRGFLHSHPNIAIPAVGSNMWTYFYKQYGDLEDPENFEKCLSALLNYKHVVFLKPDADRIRREFWQGSPTYARLFSLFLEHFAIREGKPRWGVQTGLIERYADQIIKAYPGAKFIHMLRDPRDRYAGSLELWPDGRLRAGGAVSRWFYTTHLAKRNLKKYPEAYMLVRFEDLIKHTERILKEICAFLGEEFYPEMLSLSGDLKFRNKLIQRSKFKNEVTPLSDEFIGIFRNIVPEMEIVYIQLFLRKLMKSYGYELEEHQLSFSEYKNFLVSVLPSNFIRMVFWGGQEFIQQNFPGFLGRNPALNMITNLENVQKKQK